MFTLQPNSAVIVDNGSEFVLKNGSELNLTDATMIVRNNSSLVLESGSTLDLNGASNIIIEDGSSFIYNGGIINIDSDNSYINFIGNLTIANNTCFTFNGTGYVKFSNPANDATYNVFCGTGSSMSFNGSGMNDRVIVVDQATLRLPNMSSISFSNCKIEMASGSPGRRILAEGTTDFSFNNVKLTSTNGVYNGHRGLYLYNQNITITNSQFENGLTGIRAYTTNALSISGTNFVDNSKGIYMQNSGINLDGCSFVDNTDFGLYCSNMSLPSSIDNCMFVTNENGMYYHGSTSANIDIDDTYFNESENDGIHTSGGFNCNLECCYVTDNTRYGVYAINGTKINPYKCDMSGNYHTIELDYGSVNLIGKYNQLQALNDGFTIYGYSPARCICGTIVTQDCDYNRWASSMSTHPTWNVNYKLFVLGCENPITNLFLSDPYIAYQTCGSKSTSLDPDYNIITTDKTLSSEIESVNPETKSGELSSSTNYEHQLLNQMNQYQNLFHSNNPISYNTYASVYNRIQEIIAEYYMSINLDSEDFEFNDAADLVIDFNTALTVSDENISELDNYWYKLDIALLNRMRKNYTIAIEQLEDLISFYATSEILSTSDIKFAENWLCVINAEKLFSEGLLSDDEFITSLENCQICAETRSSETNDFGGSEERSTLLSIDSDINLSISPNPNSGNFMLTIHNIESDYEIKIFNYLGQQVRNYQKNIETQTISVEGLSQGHYSVVILVNGEVCKTEKIIVE